MVRTLSPVTAAALAALVVVVTSSQVASAASGAQRCAAAKRKAAGKATKGLAACDGRAALRGITVDLGCVAHVGVAFSRAWSRAERKGGCATSGDQLVVEDRIDAHDASMQTLLGVGAGFGSRCTAGKVRDSGRAAFCQLICAAKAAKAGKTSSDPIVVRCRNKCANKLAGAFARAESRRDCRTTGDLASASSTIGAFVDCIAGLISPNGSMPCAGPTTTTATTTTLAGTSSTSTTTVAPGSTSSTTMAAGTTSTTTTATTPSTTSSTAPPTQCCIPSSLGGAFICVPESAAQCALDGGTDVGPGACTPDPCATLTTTSSTSSTTTSSAPDTTTTATPTTTSSSSSTLLACGGLFPACLGSCPPGDACTAANLLDPCVCVPVPTSSSTTTTTLLACGGVFPVCLGSCPPGQTCTGSLLTACGCQ